MDIIKDKIEDSKYVPLLRLQEEFNYWDGKIHEFHQINKTLKTLQAEEQKVLEQQQLFYSQIDTDIPASKRKCWKSVEEKFKQKLDEINQLKQKAAKTLISFFSVRGQDRILYSNNIGNYYVDEYGHKCYVFDHGLNNFHVDCDGKLVKMFPGIAFREGYKTPFDFKVLDKDRYFYDNMGRFIVKKSGEKFYQAAPCSSTYKIDKDIFVKETKDCGHSEQTMMECYRTIKDPNDQVNLPEVKPLDIKGKLDSEMVQYLWETFGHVLPEVLRDVAELNCKNPTYELAHQLLVYKYKNTDKDLMRKKQEAILYRENIKKERLEKMKQTHEAWKAKQVKRRLPEELDVAEEKFTHDAYVNLQNFIRSLDNYD